MCIAIIVSCLYSGQATIQNSKKNLIIKTVTKSKVMLGRPNSRFKIAIKITTPIAISSKTKTTWPSTVSGEANPEPRRKEQTIK